jgi:hypothetical protein
MFSLTDKVKLNLHKLIGLKMSRTALAGNMRTLQFGNTEARKSGGVVGEYALHIQCSWRLESDAGLITGDDDLYVPFEEIHEQEEAFDWGKGGSLQEKILREFLKGYDENTRQIVNSTNLLVVDEIHSDSAGGFCLALSGGYRLLVFPNGTRREAWRLFRPTRDGYPSDERHFVVPSPD